MRRLVCRVTLVLMLLVFVGACTSAPKQGPPPAGPTEVTLAAGADGVQAVTIDSSDSYKFTPSTVHAKPGKLRITLVNKAKSSTHSLAFKTGPTTAEIPFLGPGQTKSVEFTVTTPGKYEYFCTFHESLGQIGYLIVSA